MDQNRNSDLARMLARLAGFAICIAYAVIGTAVLLLLTIGGLWEGFARREFVLFFLAAVLYVYGTVYVAYRFARAPGRLPGLLLAVLVAPVLVHLVSSISDRHDLRRAAETYAREEDPRAVEAARQRLLAQGRRAGDKEYIGVLLRHLQAAEGDRQRVRLVCMLGVLSYQHERVLERLRVLREATSGEPERARLQRAVERALLQINPYQRDLTLEELQGLEPSPAACSAEALGDIRIPAGPASG